MRKFIVLFVMSLAFMSCEKYDLMDSPDYQAETGAASVSLKFSAIPDGYDDSINVDVCHIYLSVGNLAPFSRNQGKFIEYPSYKYDLENKMAEAFAGDTLYLCVYYWTLKNGYNKKLHQYFEPFVLKVTPEVNHFYIEID